MSGGLDSSVAAKLLLEQGYDLIGMTIRFWEDSSIKETDVINDAKYVADFFGFPHHVFDYRKEFKETVIKNFINEYLAGRTPNPCTLCNRVIKWEVLKEKARLLACDYISTGHYAGIGEFNGRYFICKGKDKNKDQSYMLWKLNQDDLAKTVFPLGDYSKDEIRGIALDYGLKNLAQKKESYEVCFIPDDNYRKFLIENVEELNENSKEGNFISPLGEVLGKHKGYPFYTIGQRKGLEVALGEPMYVKEICAKKNEVMIAPREQVQSKQMLLEDVNFMKYNSLDDLPELTVKVRYRGQGTKCSVKSNGERIIVEFTEEVFAITPGQSAVFYEGSDVVMGGVIAKGL
jgi:tRNA-specific 2-thiouridylase